jgi:hypothetical protein
VRPHGSAYQRRIARCRAAREDRPWLRAGGFDLASQPQNGSCRSSQRRVPLSISLLFNRLHAVSGQPCKSMRELDTEGRVIYIGWESCSATPTCGRPTFERASGDCAKFLECFGGDVVVVDERSCGIDSLIERWVECVSRSGPTITQREENTCEHQKASAGA